jgi:hypothetical protein
MSHVPCPMSPRRRGHLGTLWDICHLVARIDIRATDVMSQCLTCHTQKSATFCDIRDIRGTPLPPPAFCLPPTALWMLQTLQNAPLFEPNGVFIIFLRGTLPISPQRAESDFAQTAGRPSSSTAPLFSRSTGLARYASGAHTAATAAMTSLFCHAGCAAPDLGLSIGAGAPPCSEPGLRYAILGTLPLPRDTPELRRHSAQRTGFAFRRISARSACATAT